MYKKFLTVFKSVFTVLLMFLSILGICSVQQSTFNQSKSQKILALEKTIEAVEYERDGWIERLTLKGENLLAVLRFTLTPVPVGIENIPSLALPNLSLYSPILRHGRRFSLPPPAATST